MGGDDVADGGVEIEYGRDGGHAKGRTAADFTLADCGGPTP
jgi:hypothetical protein